MADNMTPFKASDIVKHFKELESTGENKWWNNYVIFDWTNIRESNTTSWMSIKYTPNINTRPEKLIISIRNEVHTGRIMPTSVEEIAELRTQFPGQYDEAVPRTMKPSLQFQKWACKVDTEPDGVTIKKDNIGNDILPPDEYLSDYYLVAEYMSKIFKEEFEDRIRRGNKYDDYIREHKNTTPEEVKKHINHVNKGDTIITMDMSTYIKSNYGKNKDLYNKFIDGVIIVKASKLGSIVQGYISDNAKKNKGMALPNPLARIALVFDAKGFGNTNILDKSKPICRKDGSVVYDFAIVNNSRINSDNVHKFIQSKSIIDGVISLDSVCFSQLGISVPIKASLIIVQHPVKKELDVGEQCAKLYSDPSDRIVVTDTDTDRESPTSTEDLHSTERKPSPVKKIISNLDDDIDDFANELNA
jgi:hypothetical protein